MTFLNIKKFVGGLFINSSDYYRYIERDGMSAFYVNQERIGYNMIIFELDKEDIEYADRICDLAEMSIVIEEPRSFSSDLNTVIQIGVTLAPYAISGVTLIIIELLKNRKTIRIKVTDDGFEVEGTQERAVEVAKELIEQRQDEKAQKLLNNLLAGK